MSAIVGIYHRHGLPVSRDDIDRMLARLSHCGPDDKGVVNQTSNRVAYDPSQTAPISAEVKQFDDLHYIM